MLLFTSVVVLRLNHTEMIDDPQRPRPGSRHQVNCLAMMAKSLSAHFCDSVHQGRPDSSQPSLRSSDASRQGEARPFHTSNMICLKVPCPWHESIKVNSSLLSTGCQVEPDRTKVQSWLPPGVSSAMWMLHSVHSGVAAPL